MVVFADDLIVHFENISKFVGAPNIHFISLLKMFYALCCA